MSYTLKPERVISTWITNVRRELENGDTEAALTFLGALECDWKKYQRGKLEPMTIHTGNRMGEKMSVTLFHCSHCNIYTTSATVSLYVSATLNPKRGMLRVGDDTSLPEGYSIPLENIVESHCPECSRVTELVTLDECPHQWGEWRIGVWRGEVPTRTCNFCDEVQQGKIVP